VFVGAWCASPYVGFIGLALAFSARPLSLGIILAGILASAGFATYLVYIALYLYPDPQSGVVILVIPFYQWLGVAIAAAAAAVLGWLWRTASPDAPGDRQWISRGMNLLMGKSEKDNQDR
jgi:hypothetical protein